MNFISKLSLNQMSLLLMRELYFKTREGAWKSEQTHLYFADINFSYLIDALNQDVTLEACVERRSVGDLV